MLLASLPEIVNTKLVISRTILEMDIPFKISELYSKLDEKGIKDKALILDVLNQLYESGLVDYSSFEDDTFEYRSRYNPYKSV